VLLVYILDYFGGNSCLFRALDVSCEDISRKNEPDATIVILSKVAAHFYNFDIVHFLNVVAHFKALFHAVICFLPVSNHSYLISIGAEIVLDFHLAIFLVFPWRVCRKLNNNWLANSSSRFDTSLDVSDPFPFFTRCTVLEKIKKVSIPQNLQ